LPSFVKFLLPFATGIIIAYHSQWYKEWLLWVWLFCVVLYFILWKFLPKRFRFKFSPWQSLLGYIILLLAGIILVYFRNQANLPHHVLNQKENFSYFKARVISEIQEKPKSYHFVAEITEIYADSLWLKATDKINVFLEKTEHKPQFGDVFIAKNKLQLINEPLNEAQFNYRIFLSLKNIYHQQYLKPNEIVWIATQIAWYEYFEKWAIQLRSICDKIFAENIKTEQEYSIAAALVLGIKHHLDEDLKQAYTNAGVTHILAVSGMHVGIIFGLLNVFLAFLRKKPKGKLLYVVVVLIALWLYAFVTGLSGSVLRAVTMFSLLTIAQNLSRNTNIYNTLAASAFLLLLYNPFLLMDVGFQLSYLAVLSIVYFYPKLYPLYEPTNRVIHFLWQMTCVSVAAQVFTLPITLYHFHQYPTYGILASVLVVPIGQVILILGVALLIGSFLPYLPTMIGFVLEKTIWICNKIVFGVENLDYATTSLVLDAPQAIALALAILLMIAFFEAKKFMFLVGSVLAYAFVAFSFFAENLEQHKQRVFVVYAIPKSWTFSLTEGFHSQIWSDTTLSVGRLNFNSKNLLDKLGTKTKTYQSPPDWHNFGNWKFWHYAGKNFVFLQNKITKNDWLKINAIPEIDFCIVQRNAIRNLDSFQKIPKMLIIDGSNSVYLAKKLSLEANEKKIQAHNVFEKGSFRIKL
jgi:competence protein ComEC